MSDSRRLNGPSVERRTFLRYSLVGGVSLGLGGFGASVLGFLWPNLSGGFGADIKLGNAQEIYDGIIAEKKPFVWPAGRLYMIATDPTLPGYDHAYGEITATLPGGGGLMALYHKCVHLGCRVPWCQSSQWFECPCHGSKYNKWGEWKGGPAPRGLDRFPASIDGDGNIVVATGTVVTGPARTANVLQQEPEGPHCVSL